MNYYYYYVRGHWPYAGKYKHVIVPYGVASLYDKPCTYHLRKIKK